jgi:hypothetical protein
LATPVVSHPCARNKAHGWGTVLLRQSQRQKTRSAELGTTGICESLVLLPVPYSLLLYPFATANRLFTSAQFTTFHQAAR